VSFGTGGVGDSPAVTISVAKRKGANATWIAEDVIKRVEALKGKLIPDDVNVTVTRNYGETAKEKSDELLKHVMIATISVTILIALFLGLRASGVVAIAIPVTLALTILVFYLYGYTLNRVTLFALIFCIGILVDDAIVVVENIHRYFVSTNLSPMDAAIKAVDEVGNPTVLATFAVIVAILPLAFVTGLMGPYMGPIPIGASVAMVISLFIAFIISPWAAFRFLKGEASGGKSHHEVEKEGYLTILYRRIMTPLLEKRVVRYSFLAFVVLLLMGAMSLVYFKMVTVKMMPYDNKSELQVIIDMPEGTTLEETRMVAAEVGGYLRTVPEVVNFQAYVGNASPYNFNGLVRHYFLREGGNVADIQVNLVGKDERKEQSHAIAKRLRGPIQEVGKKFRANIKIAEIPPGPPVLSTLVAEIYGPNEKERVGLAEKIKGIFEKTDGVVDADWYVEDDQEKYIFVIDRERAALYGISTEDVAKTLRVALNGASAGLAHLEEEKEAVEIMLRLPLADRSRMEALSSIYLQTSSGGTVPLSQVVKIEKGIEDKTLYRKNLRSVTYVTGDVAGTEESPVYAIMKMGKEIEKIETPGGYKVEQYAARQPWMEDKLAIKWDGEWHITYEVFRDMGAAFVVSLILIYLLVVAWFKDFKIPFVIMAPIPLTLIGIFPGHALFGAFFTATSMIGFIALAGIIVRNSIILIDFIHVRQGEGMPLKEAIIDAGAVRFRPMLLTASAVMVGSFVILFDPIFQGLAIALMTGELASTLLSRIAIPVLYYMVMSGKEARTAVPNKE
jgi:multidrug efflux pump subunit AcrB